MSRGVPEHILIVGAGEFGLSTALALLSRPTFSKSRITILDSSPSLPNPAGSSVDSSRIIRTDYACRPYARLASEAQLQWRDQTPTGWGGQGRYTETGFVLTADKGLESYVDQAMRNVRELAEQGISGLDLSKIEVLPDEAAIRKATGYEGVSGHRGYANWNSGWAHAEKVVQYALDKLKQFQPSNNTGPESNRLTIRTNAKVSRLLFDHSPNDTPNDHSTSNTPSRSRGVILTTNETITADLTILATGAWTASLIDLQGRAISTAQALAYTRLTDAEQTAHEHKPVIMNLSRGTFIIPPVDNELKIARHAYGYLNPVPVTFDHFSSPPTTNGNNHDVKSIKQQYSQNVSIPLEGKNINVVPEEGIAELRQALDNIIPSLAGRPFTFNRLCWYTDTPDGNFLIDYHPLHQGSLFIATGGSGHGFKFFPIIGEKIVDRIEGVLETEYADLWAWPVEKKGDFTGCEDGSRSGVKGVIL